ncbi:hypothetical protein BOX15_Mlig014369g2, partial [Macrostomum lignano]
KRPAKSNGNEEPPWKRLCEPSASKSSSNSNRPRPLDLDSQLQEASATAAKALPALSNSDIDGVDLSGVNLTDFYLREIETDDNSASAANYSAASNPANVLKCSADFCRRTLCYEFKELTPASGTTATTTSSNSRQFRCTILLDNWPVSAMSAETKQAAKAGAGAGLLAALRQRCWTLFVRSDRAFIRAQADAGFTRPDTESAAGRTAAANADDEKIGSDNVGHRLLKGMGWSGVGGIGKRLEGRAEPVANDVRIVSRAGLGADSASGGSGATGAVSASFQTGVGRVLRDFQRDPTDRDDLFFASDFTNEERRYVQSQCLRLGLASRSYSGDNDTRCLVVSRKRSAKELVEFVRRNGGATVRYRLAAPGLSREAGDEAGNDGDGGGAGEATVTAE